MNSRQTKAAGRKTYIATTTTPPTPKKKRKKKKEKKKKKRKKKKREKNSITNLLEAMHAGTKKTRPFDKV